MSVPDDRTAAIAAGDIRITGILTARLNINKKFISLAVNSIT
jgi:hypothetical protein